MAKSHMTVMDTVYGRARKDAAVNNEKLSSRDGAAEYLYCDPRSLADYELGLRLVPPEIVVHMADTYNAPELRNHYCAHECPVGKGRVQELEIHPVERITVRISRAGREMENIRTLLEDITADGIVDSTEVDKLRQAILGLDQMVRSVNELKLWAEKNV